MSEEEKKELYTVTIYFKSGNHLQVKNLEKFDYSKGTYSWKFAEEHKGEHLLHFEADQIEAVTFVAQDGFRIF